MEVDYDIYSYIDKGIGKGDLVPKVVSEKVTYEVVGFEKIALDDVNGGTSCTRFKLQLISKNGRRLVEKNGQPVIKYVNDSIIKENFVPIDGNFKRFKRKINKLILVQVPQTIKVPMDVYSSKNFLIQKGRWIDITDINNLKFCSNKEFNLLYEIL